MGYKGGSTVVVELRACKDKLLGTMNVTAGRSGSITASSKPQHAETKHWEVLV